MPVIYRFPHGRFLLNMFVSYRVCKIERNIFRDSQSPLKKWLLCKTINIINAQLVLCICPHHPWIRVELTFYHITTEFIISNNS